MSKTQKLLFTIALILVAIASTATTLYFKAGIPGAVAIPEAGMTQMRSATYLDVNNQPQALAQWRDKILVLNFWATWCPPCRTEMPMFSQTQDELGAQGVQFVGVAIDSPSAVKEYALRYPVSYPLLTGGTPGLELMRALGNPAGGLPFTLVVDRNGQPVMSRLGLIDEVSLRQVLDPLLSGNETR